VASGPDAFIVGRMSG
jgi:WD repeat-containing protein 35